MKDRLVYITITRLVKAKSYVDFSRTIAFIKKLLTGLGFKIQMLEWDEVNDGVEE